MTTAQQWLDLAERIEAATGADREIDAALHMASTSFEPRIAGPGWIPQQQLVVPAGAGWAPLPAYTASIDTVMKLIPSGLAFAVATIRNGAPDDWDDSVCSAVVAQRDGFEARSDATTPALALAAAACRARAGMEG